MTRVINSLLPIPKSLSMVGTAHHVWPNALGMTIKHFTRRSTKACFVTESHLDQILGHIYMDKAMEECFKTVVNPLTQSRF